MYYLKAKWLKKKVISRKREMTSNQSINIILFYTNYETRDFRLIKLSEEDIMCKQIELIHIIIA